MSLSLDESLKSSLWWSLSSSKLLHCGLKILPLTTPITFFIALSLNWLYELISENWMQEELISDSKRARSSIMALSGVWNWRFQGHEDPIILSHALFLPYYTDYKHIHISGIVLIYHACTMTFWPYQTKNYHICTREDPTKLFVQSIIVNILHVHIIFWYLHHIFSTSCSMVVPHYAPSSDNHQATKHSLSPLSIWNDRL